MTIPDGILTTKAPSECSDENGHFFSGQMVSVQLEPGARAAGFPFGATRQATSWSFTIGHPRIAYLYPADAPAELFSARSSEKLATHNARRERKIRTATMRNVLTYLSLIRL